MVTTPSISRRTLLLAGAGAAASAGQAGGALASDAPLPRHGLSIFGDLALPADFPHFAYVDPAAPKGGTMTMLAGAGVATFNSLNGFILRGDPAIGLGYCFASLMVRAFDEPDALYGLAAETVTVSADGTTYRYRLRPGIAFHDGTPITPADVVFSLDVLKEKGHPSIRMQLRDLEKVEATAARDVTLTFARTRARDVPLFAAGLPILSAAYYATREFDQTTLEPPLGSGPYRVGRFEQGRFMEFERVRDWWGAGLPVARGQHNFDILRFEYFRDRDVAFEAFTARAYHFREEFTSAIWAQRYDFPAIRDGRVKRETLPDATPSGAQGWMINTRRERFADRRVREALSFAFDFEWTNRNLMFNSFQRTHSYFENSPMAARGAPSPAERALLEPFRGRVPDEVFAEVWTPPVSDGTGADRNLMRRADQLLNEAGWTVRNGQRVDQRGARMRIEFLIFERSFERHHQAFVQNLNRLGLETSIRLVDPAQYRARVEDFDFDVTVSRMVFPLTPGAVLRNYFSSDAARTKGTDNLPGIADPAVDALLERVIAASSRDELNTAAQALDRVLRAGRYWIPHWYKASHWIAYWDLFGRPERKPAFARGVPETWWLDRAKAQRAG